MNCAEPLCPNEAVTLWMLSRCQGCEKTYTWVWDKAEQRHDAPVLLCQQCARSLEMGSGHVDCFPRYPLSVFEPIREMAQ